MRPIVFVNLDVLATSRASAASVRAAFNKSYVLDSEKFWRNVFSSAACAELRTLHEMFVPQYVVTAPWSHVLSDLKIATALDRTGTVYLAKNLHRDWRTPKAMWMQSGAEIDWWYDANPGDRDRPFVILDNWMSETSLRKSLRYLKRTVFCAYTKGFNAARLAEAQEIIRLQLARPEQR